VGVVAGYIYVLKPNLLVGGHSVVKIGMTTRSVAKRVRELSMGSPVALELVCSLHVEDPKAIEKHLHRKFAAYRISAGGGTEYFHIEAQHVVAEIDRIGAHISKQRARIARDAEVRKYKEEIGAGVLERRIEKITMRVSLTLFVSLIALGGLKEGWGILFAALFPGLFLFGGIQLGVNWLLTNRWFKPRFGAQIAAKYDELRPRFPLAYEA
jgi:hypothetical protein